MPAQSFARGAMGGANLAMSLMDFRRRGEMMERQEQRQEEAHGLSMQAGRQQLDQSAEQHEWTRTNQELTNRIRTMQLDELESAEQNRRLLAYLRVFDAYDGLRRDDPELDDDRIRDAGHAAAELFTPLIQQEGGPQRKITDIIPVEDGLTLELDDQYPMTQRRSSDPDDPVAVIPWHHAFAAIEDMGEKFAPLMDRFAGVVEEFGHDPSSHEGRRMMTDLVRAELGDTSALDARAKQAQEGAKHQRAMQLEAFKSTLRLRETLGEKMADGGGGRYSETDIERHRSGAERAFNRAITKAFDEAWVAEPGRASALATTQQVLGETISLYQQAGLDVPVTEIGSAAARIMAQAEHRFPNVLWDTAEMRAREDVKEEFGNRGTTPQMIRQRALEIQDEAIDSLYDYTRTAMAQLFPVHRQVADAGRGTPGDPTERPTDAGDGVQPRQPAAGSSGAQPERAATTGTERPERPAQRRVVPEPRDTATAAAGRVVREEGIPGAIERVDDTLEEQVRRIPGVRQIAEAGDRLDAFVSGILRRTGQAIKGAFTDLVTAPPSELPEGVREFGRSIEIGRTPERAWLDATKQWAADPANERFVKPALIDAVRYWEDQLGRAEQHREEGGGADLVDSILEGLSGI